MKARMVAPWFETRFALLTMRITYLLPSQTLILRSGVFAASRRMKARMVAPWFETALRASSP
jgi:hypothetical protein